MARLTAVTFDFWNTLMWEVPRGLIDARLRALTGVLDGAGVDAAALEAAHECAFEEYQAAWRANRQYVAADAVTTMASHLGVEDNELIRSLAAALEVGSSCADVRPCEGMVDTVQQLAGAGVRLGIVCDIGLTPSPIVRSYLDAVGVLDLFVGLAFSDEVGCYKPDPRIFEHALGLLGVDDPSLAMHVGDRTRTDVAGAQRMGMAAVRYTAVYDDTEGEPAADHVIDDLRALIALAT